MFQLNQQVHRSKERQDEHGTIIELADERARILWDGNPEMAKLHPDCNTYRSKRTWMSLNAIAASN
jgi:hypothetical protein